MGKLIVLLCFALIAMTLVMACTPPGMLCASDDDCCGAFVCNPWAANRCTRGPGAGSPWGAGGPAAAGAEWPQNEPAQ